MNYKKHSLLVVTLFATNILSAQEPDSINPVILDEIQILDNTDRVNIERLPEVKGAVIYSGKKNEVIKLNTQDADLSTNNVRQVFAKVPGVSVWENDGSGIQVGIAARGLSPNRSWEFNVRQNGYDISAEAFGYPESYFSPPMEALSSIELVRGASSLQFGPQFGGLLNYILKKGDPNKTLVFETRQTYGSYGLFNSFNSVGGTNKRISYYAYFHHRNADGWRQNSRYYTNTGYASLNYAINKKCNLELQYTRADFESQQPGGLTDSLFKLYPQQSLRSRNWLSAPWNVASANFEYRWKDDVKLDIKLFATIAERKSVGFVKPINTADVYNVELKSFNSRQVDKDVYNNTGAEIRYLNSYNLLGNKSALAAGVRLYRGRTERSQLGIGTGNNDVDFNIASIQNGKKWGRHLDFVTINYATFVENIFKISKKLSVTPGLRYEIINSSMAGYINTGVSGVIPNENRKRQILLAGCGSEFKTSSATNLYCNFSQAFRPVTFSELTPSATTDIIDPNLKDAYGYNLDGGFRGKVKEYLNFDIGLFYLNYTNRIGNVVRDNTIFRTNVGTSVSKGLESYVEIDLFKIRPAHPKTSSLKLFISYAYIDARYTKWNNPAIANDKATSIIGKRVENAPNTIARGGINYRFKGMSVNWQMSYVSDVYADAVNTENPNAAATTGKIAAYTVMDASFNYEWKKKYDIKFGVNNLLNEKYATRRAGGYPGPGLLPANGRTFYVSVGAKF